MDTFPSFTEAKKTVEKIRAREEKEQQVFLPSVDQEEAAACLCEHCPPRSDQDPWDYCCSSLFSLPPLENGQRLRDGLTRELREPGRHPCITQDPHFTTFILTEAAVRSAAEMYSLLNREPITDVNKSYRYGAYRLLIANTIGHTGLGVRIRLPSCFVHKVRQLWPSANYKGFV